MASNVAVDLRGLDSVRVRVVGTVHVVPDHLRGTAGDVMYLLVREPDNEYDACAIAVYAKGRRVGYVPASRAAAMAPLLDALKAPSVVTGVAAQEHATRLWVDLPRAAALRTFVASVTGQA